MEMARLAFHALGSAPLVFVASTAWEIIRLLCFGAIAGALFALYLRLSAAS